MSPSFNLVSRFSGFSLASFLALGAAVSQAVEPPVLTPDASDSAVGFDVTVTSHVPGAEIRYTLSGEDPTSKDPIVVSGGTIRISRSAVLKARAWAGSDASDVVSAEYRLTGAAGLSAIHGLALGIDGKAWSWGMETNGRLGNMVTTATAKLSPVRVLAANGVDEFDDAVAMGIGDDHSLLVDSLGSVWAFGMNANGELGNGLKADSGLPVQVQKSPGLALGNCVRVAGGDGFSIAQDSSGAVWTWGTNASGATGIGKTWGSQLYAVPVARGDDPSFPPLTGIQEVASGVRALFGMAREPNAFESPGSLGRVWVWGNGSYGKLAQGNTANLSRAMPMMLDPTTELTDAWSISGSGQHSMVVRWHPTDPDLQGTVWSCGRRQAGRLGLGGSIFLINKELWPKKVVRADNGKPLDGIIQVAAGNAHTLALHQDGTVWSWGHNSRGQLGIGNTRHKTAAVQVKNFDGTGFLQNIVWIAAGGLSPGYNAFGTSLAIEQDGTIWVWGHNRNAQLGTGTAEFWRGILLPREHQNNIIDEGVLSVALSTTMVSSMEMGEVTVTATPSHSGSSGVGAIDRVDIYLNGSVVSSLFGAPWTTNLDGLVEGDYRLVVVARDTNGVSAMSDPDTFSISLNPLMDADGDGLTNGDELNVHSTDPRDPDSDGDGMEDGYEEWHGFDPKSKELGTDHSPMADADGDGVSNLVEHDAGRMCNLVSEYFSPLEFLSGTVSWFARAGFWYTIEVSEDLSNWQMYPMGFLGINQEVSVDWETWWGYRPSRAFIRLRYGPASSFDADGDGLSPELEFQLGLDPTMADTDGNGIRDGDEDSDGDGIPNAVEEANGTDASDAETIDVFAGAGAGILTPLAG